MVLDRSLGAEVVEQGGGEPDGRPRRRWPLLVGATALVLVGGGVAAYFLLGDDAARNSDGIALPEAMTSEPEVAWTRPGPGGSVSGLSSAGDRVFVVDDDGAMVALDRDDGEEVWTRDDQRTAFAVGVPGDDDLLLVGSGDGPGLGAFAAEDGEERWWLEDAGYPLFFQDGGVLVDFGDNQGADPVGWVDLRTGRERWRTESEFAGLGDGAVYVVSEDELRKVDIGSGKTEWIGEAPIDAEHFATVAVAGSLVAVSRGDEATAYDTDSGDELWSVSAQGDGATMAVGVFDEQRVYVSEMTYGDEDDGPVTTVTVRGRGDAVEDLDVDPNGFFFGVALRAEDGRSWFLDYADGGLFDQSAEQVAQYDGDVVPLDRGLYAKARGRLSYFPYGAEEPTWEVALPDTDGEESVLDAAVDRGFLVAADGDVTMYR